MEVPGNPPTAVSMAGDQRDEEVSMLIAVLGDEVDAEEAARLLDLSGGDVNLAIALHFDGGLIEQVGDGLDTSAVPGGQVHESSEDDEGPAPTQDFEQTSEAHLPQDPNCTAGLDLSAELDEAKPKPPTKSLAPVSSGRPPRPLSPMAGPGDVGPDDREPPRSQNLKAGHSLGSAAESSDDDAVFVLHSDAAPEPRLASQLQPARRAVRPGTAPASRGAGQDMRDLLLKKEAMRCVVGNDVEDNILEHLLRINAMDVQAAIEAYFDVGNAGGLDMIASQLPFSAHDPAPEAGASERSPQRSAQRVERRSPEKREGRSDSPEESDDGPRKPFEDLCGMIGNGVKPNALAPLMVESEGDVSKALELFVKMYTGPNAVPLPKDEVDSSPEAYYLRPEKPVQVICNVYDLCWSVDKSGKKNKTNSGLTGVGLGIYHSGIEVYGREVSFGYSDDGCTGVFEVPPRCAAGVMPNITFKEGVVMGTLNRSRFEVDHLLQRLAKKYQGDTYDLVRRNCNHFANELCVCLVGKKIPSYINRPANVGRVLLNTFQVPAMAIGKMIDGVKGAGKRKDSQDAVVVPAPTAAAAMSGAGGNSAQRPQGASQLRDLPPASAASAGSRLRRSNSETL